MGKKKEEAPPPGSPAWMATFSDLMNLLVCFFVLLFSMSSVDAAKYEQIVKSFSETFSIFEAGGSSVGDGVMVSNGVSQLTNLSTFFSSMGMNDTGRPDNDVEADTKDEGDQGANGMAGESGENEEGFEQPYEERFEEVAEQKRDITTEEAQETLEQARIRASEELAEKIQEMLNENGEMASNISIDFTSQYVVLRMDGALLFESGSDTIKNDAKPFLTKIGQILTKYAEGTVEIEGHTDNVPMSGRGKFASNDELSSARALSVFHFLIENSFMDPSRLKHSGRGEYAPIADNSTSEGRQKNRRVEVKIYNYLSDIT